MAEAPTRKLAVLLHADVVGSTALVQLNETLAHHRIQDTFRRLSETIATHGGIAPEIRGDALVAEFSKASDAVEAALAFQAGNAAHNRELQDEIHPVVRVGIAHNVWTSSPSLEACVSKELLTIFERVLMLNPNDSTALGQFGFYLTHDIDFLARRGRLANANEMPKHPI
ncbi:MAG: hypothetical protein OEQ39_24900 [Gammaproteobacteria bacterium]|nr:hypothetical protein [Gammaproteobacteria bacterium]MDH3468225.1 hypothetical protein [Gammaproteobacteria bacterium]